MIKTKEKVHFSDLGIIDYKKAWDLQEKYLKGIIDIKMSNRDLSDSEQEKTPHYLLFCEHPPVVTLARSGSIDNLLFNENFLAQRGVQFYKNNRGGDITFHGYESGIVYLHMQGACAGCPSSTMTLKMGIENLLKHFIPEVQEVRPIAA